MTSKYLDLYNKLSGEIRNNGLKKGSKLPSEKELMEIYSVSRDTVRKSLTLLESNGYINKIKGKGSFVLNISDKYNFPITGLVSFTEMIKQMGASSKTSVVYFQKEMADDFEQSVFLLEKKEELLIIKRQREINGEKVILDVDIILDRYVPGMTKTIAEKSIFRFIEKELRLKIGFARKEISVIPAQNDDYKYLDMKEFNFIVLVDTIIFLDDGNVLQHTQSRHRPDRFKFVDFAKRM